MEVVREEHDAIAGGDACDGDESHEGGDGDIIEFKVGEEESADEGERDITKHLDGKEGTPKIAVEKERDHHENDRTEEGDPLRGCYLGLKFAFVGNEVAFGESDFFVEAFLELFHRGADITDTRFDGDGEASLGIFAEDHIGAFGFADGSEEAEGDSLDPRVVIEDFDGKFGELLDR